MVILMLFVLFIVCPVLAPVLGWWTLVPIAISWAQLAKYSKRKETYDT